MKLPYSVILACLALLGPAREALAQQEVIVEEVIREMSLGTHTGYEMFVPEVTFKGVESRLSKYLRKGSRGRVETANGEMYIRGAVNKNISPEPFNIYVRHHEVHEGIRLTAYFTPDDTLFFTPSLDHDQSVAIRKYLRDFGVERFRALVKDEVEVQKRRLKQLEDELEDLIKARQKSERKIKEARRNIQKNKENLRNKDIQDSLKGLDILHQQDIVNRLKGTGSEEEKMAQRHLKDLKKEKRKFEKSMERTARDNDQLLVDIENEQRSIGKNEGLQEEKEKEIKEQKEKVKAIEDKLDGIR